MRLRTLVAMARDHLGRVQRPVNVLVAGDDGRPCMALIVDERQTIVKFPVTAFKSTDKLGIQSPAIAHLNFKGMFQAEAHDFLWLEPSRHRPAAA